MTSPLPIIVDSAVSKLLADAQTVVECVVRDDCGQMVGQVWMGGNGGMLSRETLQAVDRLRRTIAETAYVRKPQ